VAQVADALLGADPDRVAHPVEHVVDQLAGGRHGLPRLRDEHPLDLVNAVGVGLQVVLGEHVRFEGRRAPSAHSVDGDAQENCDCDDDHDHPDDLVHGPDLPFPVTKTGKN